MGRIEIFEAHQNILVTFQICPRANYLGCYWCRFKRYIILHCIVLQDHGKIKRKICLFRLKKFLLFFCFIYPLFFFIFFFFFVLSQRKTSFTVCQSKKSKLCWNWHDCTANLLTDYFYFQELIFRVTLQVIIYNTV